MKTDSIVRQPRVARHSGGGLGNPAGAWTACWLLLLPGCAPDPAIYGLHPAAPPQRMGAKVSGSDVELEFPKVAGNPPVLKWKAYVPEPESGAGVTSPGLVTYDLRIWEMRHGQPASLVYEKSALPKPKHVVEYPLKPGTPHFWSVRARIESDGATQLTEWSRSLRSYQTDFSVMRPAEVPATNYFRFVTPGCQHNRITSELRSWKDFFATKELTGGADLNSVRTELFSWKEFFDGNFTM